MLIALNVYSNRLVLQFFNAVMDEVNKNKIRKAIWFEYKVIKQVFLV